jgi:hypothetical protein
MALLPAASEAAAGTNAAGARPSNNNDVHQSRMD